MKSMSALIRAALAVALSASITACGGGGGGSSSALPAGTSGGSNGSTNGTGSNSGNGGTVTPLSGPINFGMQALQGATPTGPAQVGVYGVDVALQLQNERGLIDYAQRASDPSSPLYRNFLTPQQIGDMFGAKQVDYDAVGKFFAAQGLHVQGWPQRLALHVYGSQAAMEKAFSMKLGNFTRTTSKGTFTFMGPTSAPLFSANLPIRAITTVVSSRKARPMYSRINNAAVSGYTPAQMRAAFDYNGAYAAGFNGSGISVGIIGTGPISPADVPEYAKLYNSSAAPVNLIVAQNQPNTINYDPSPSTLSTPQPLTGPCQGDSRLGAPPSEFPTATCNPEDGEAQIDTEQAATLAPGSNVNFYFAYNPAYAQPVPGGQPVTAFQGLALSDDEIQQAIADNASDILSLSFGGGEADNVSAGYLNPDGTGLGPAEFAALAAEGIATFVSSGDQGAEECINFSSPGVNPDAACASYPATDPDVVSVGGVLTPLDDRGRLVGNITTWGLQTSNGTSGSGGGPSVVFNQPAYQTGPGISGSTRLTPDVSLDADTKSGVATLAYADPQYAARSISAYGGTSVAAPEMAAMWALVLQACKANSSCAKGPSAHPYRLGNPNPYFYKIYNGKGQLPYANTFYDVIYGFNPMQNSTGNGTLDPGFGAGPGYDLTTGIGVPFGRNLIKAVVGS